MRLGDDTGVHGDNWFRVDPDTPIKIEFEDGFPVAEIGDPPMLHIRFEGHTARTMGALLVAVATEHARMNPRAPTDPDDS